mmetsp:Transcript_3754/g.8573  ORF Transcript_3754/g.8573 Transcript_3754/m.8573 type:complete len:282 (+) Transcript_3754:2-847(+)
MSFRAVAGRLLLTEAFQLGNESVQVKNTFIHVDLPYSSSRSLLSGSMVLPQKWITAPAIVQQRSFRTVEVDMQIAHLEGRCKPCAYFYYKQDGCRRGDRCQFCHLCTRGEIRRRKKDRTKIFRTQGGEMGQVQVQIAAAGTGQQWQPMSEPVVQRGPVVLQPGPRPVLVGGREVVHVVQNVCGHLRHGHDDRDKACRAEEVQDRIVATVQEAEAQVVEDSRRAGRLIKSVSKRLTGEFAEVARHEADLVRNVTHDLADLARSASGLGHHAPRSSSSLRPDG